MFIKWIDTHLEHKWNSLNLTLQNEFTPEREDIQSRTCKKQSIQKCHDWPKNNEHLKLTVHKKDFHRIHLGSYSKYWHVKTFVFMVSIA